MKKTLALILSCLMLLPCLVPFASFADAALEITESKKGYTGSIGYGGYIVRTKSDGSIMFSPFMEQFKAIIDGGENIDNYTVEMTFILLDKKNGNRIFTHDTVSGAIKKSNGTYFDVFLNGSGGNAGFCPTAGKFYDIEVNIYKNYGKSNEDRVLYGTYLSAEIPSKISTSKYYKPTSGPTNYNITVSYSFNNELAGSAAGYVYVNSDSEGTFQLKWGDKDGKPLTVKSGNRTLTYSELASFTIKGANGGKHTEKILSFTAIPVGAKKLLVTDPSDKVIQSLDLPANKLLEDKEYNHSFGIISDVHFNYFFDSSKKIDYAENAFDTALAFYKDAGVKLVAAAGDYSLYGEEESYREFNAGVLKYGIPVIACGGNHELYAKLDVMFGKTGYWRKYMNVGAYDGTLPGVLNIAENGIDLVYQIPGVTDSVFISLSQWYWDGHSPAQQKLVEPQQLVWLEEQFKLYKDKTVYLLFHTYLSDDDYENIDGQGDLKSDGGYSYNGHYNEHTDDEKKFRELLTQYDNVIWYNGHSHYEYSMQKYNENLNIYDYQGTTATMIHVPSLTNPRTVASGATSYSSMAGDASYGALQFVYDDYEIMNGIDLWNDQILSYACYIIYTDKSDVIEEGTIADGKITWTYDAQLNTLRFMGNGEIPAFNKNAPWAKFNSSIITVYIGNGITGIGKDTFADLTNVKSVEIKEGVTTIGENTFKSGALTYLRLPETLKEIGKNAFVGSENINTISYGGSAEAWEKLTIAEGNKALTGDVIFEKIKITFVAGDMTETIDVKFGTSPLYDGLPAKYHEDENKHYPFTGWKNGSKVYKPTETLPKATKNTTYTAVFGDEVNRYESGKLMNGLIKWELDRKTATLTVSGGGTVGPFEDPADRPWAKFASEIRKVVVKSGFKSLGRNAFCRLPVLKTIVIEEGLTSLQMDCFAYNEQLTELYLPSTLKTVGQGVAYNSDNIKTIYYYGKEADWQDFIAGITAMYNTNITGAENLIYLTHCEGEHTPSSWRYDNGTHTYTCEKCRTTSEPEKHTLGDWVVIKEATATEDGTKSRSCVCGYTISEVIPATGDTTPDTTPDSTNAPSTSTDTATPVENNSDVIIIVIAAVGGLAVVAVIVVVILKKKKK